MDNKILHPQRMNEVIRDKVHYAVRGEVVIHADNLRKQLQQPSHKLPFTEIISCNIGNPQSLGQKPLTFIRQVLSLVQYPELLKEPPKIYKADMLARAKKYLSSFPSVGAYSHSKGLEIVRQEVAQFLKKRDGFDADPETIFLSDGASPAVKGMLQIIIRNEKDGILIPIPQYPLYSASIPLFYGTPVHYYLEEEKGWTLSLSHLEEVVEKARKDGITPRALVCINPGNPTGQCLSHENMKEVIRFCHKERIVLMADEVYQQNCYMESKPFRSFKRTLREMGDDYKEFELVSFHSVSKGFIGECGQRGGYMELVGIHPTVIEHVYKLASVSLCSNVTGQITVGLMVNPPQEGDESYEEYVKESTAIYESLKRRGKKLAGLLNTLDGVSCTEPEGAMYLFPKIPMTKKAIQAAKEKGITPDTLYSFELVDATGIVVVPGSGFGQREGTHHFRTTFLPQEDKIDGLVDKYNNFHKHFLTKYAD